jgi:hypothetical protein
MITTTAAMSQYSVKAIQLFGRNLIASAHFVPD